MILSSSSSIRAWLLALASLAVLSALGCVSTRTPELRQDVEALRAQLASLLKSNERLEAEVAALQKARSTPGLPSTDLAALDARIGSLEGQISALRQRLDDAQERMATLSLDVQSVRELALRAQPPRLAPSRPPEGDLEAPVTPGEEGSSTGIEDYRTEASVEDSYSAAYADFTRGSYALAIAGFEEFLEKYPDSELSDNAQFWVAESHFSEGDYDTAAARYDLVIQRYPKGDRVPAAYLKRGLCLMETSRTAEGVVLLQHLIQTYPTSEEAALARDRLEGMGVKP